MFLNAQHPFASYQVLSNNKIFLCIHKNIFFFFVKMKTTLKELTTISQYFFSLTPILNIKIESFYDYYTLETEPTLQEPTKKKVRT